MISTAPDAARGRSPEARARSPKASATLVGVTGGGDSLLSGAGCSSLVSGAGGPTNRVGASGTVCGCGADWRATTTGAAGEGSTDCTVAAAARGGTSCGVVRVGWAVGCAATCTRSVAGNSPAGRRSVAVSLASCPTVSSSARSAATVAEFCVRALVATRAGASGLVAGGSVTILVLTRSWGERRRCRVDWFWRAARRSSRLARWRVGCAPRGAPCGVKDSDAVCAIRRPSLAYPAMRGSSRPISDARGNAPRLAAAACCALVSRFM